MGKTKQPSIGTLLSSVVGDISTLFRKEVELAKAEIKEDATKAALGVGLLAGAGVAALFAVGTLNLALAFLLDHWMPRSLAFLTVGLIYVAGAALLVNLGKKELNRLKEPSLTVESIKEDIEWLRPGK